MNQHALFSNSAVAPNEYEIVFDGGAIGNPGRAYGSYKITGPDGEIALERLNYDHISTRMTNNQAEYRTLIAALEWLADRLGPEARQSSVQIYGDSLLVISQLRGIWKVKKADLRPLVDQALAALKRFGAYDLQWHDRSNSVRELGH
jgi:ribonuclease HI